MNIFYLDHNTEKCAEYHHDKHVVKMILESVQLLSNAIQFHGGYSKYAATHMNHPCSIWVRESNQNWLWLFSLVIDLDYEYCTRFNKNEDCHHKSFYIAMELFKQVNLLPKGKFTEPPFCMPDQYKNCNVINSYRKYYKAEKVNEKTKWTGRNIPKFIKKED